ncbi:Na+/H+ antiporter NhaA [Chloroflexi bacterium]|nr:Na+/H+ antiporter NhaA [Chloroflexota bacterium]
MPVRMLREFFLLESAGGILLVISAAIAISITNSPLENLYHDILHAPVVLQIGKFSIDLDLHHWINDGLMAIFFLLVSLEIKREVLDGQLSSRSQISLPVIAAFGGLICPSIIYISLNWGNSSTLQGWAIPAATDIAFALGVLTLLGNRVPESLKLTLVSIAIIDDLAAIVIIAIFYTESLSMLPLVGAFLCVLALFTLNKKKISELSPYMVAGTLLWVCVLKSGLHATLAGVVVAMFIPAKGKNDPVAKERISESVTLVETGDNTGVFRGSIDDRLFVELVDADLNSSATEVNTGEVSVTTRTEQDPLYRLEHGLHIWVAFLILPLFALANAGVSLAGLSIDLFTEQVTLGVGLGLLFGKQIGVMLFTYIGVILRFCALPEGIRWSQYYGLALLSGIGFTMSLFIGELAFDDDNLQTLVRLGVITASLLSGILGYFTLRIIKTEQLVP